MQLNKDHSNRFYFFAFYSINIRSSIIMIGMTNSVMRYLAGNKTLHTFPVPHFFLIYIYIIINFIIFYFIYLFIYGLKNWHGSRFSFIKILDLRSYSLNTHTVFFLSISLFKIKLWGHWSYEKMLGNERK